MSVTDKVIIITGGARGIGLVYSKKFAEAGAKVIMAGRDESRGNQEVASIVKKGYYAEFIKTDISSETDTQVLARTTIDKHGRIDVLINNAAYLGSPQPFDQIPVEEWDAVMAVNLRGTWLCCKAVAPFMKAAKKGKIILTSSSAWDVGVPRWLYYVTSKAGLVGMTRGLASELGEYNINVNCVSYSHVLTERNLPRLSKEQVEQRVQSQLLKRPPTPEEIFGAVMFLSSEESNFVTGQTIYPNGGGYLH